MCEANQAQPKQDVAYSQPKSINETIAGREVTLRERLEKELHTIYKRADQIVEVLKDLTPETEKLLLIQKRLEMLGISRYY